jgi:hypothetical protein
MAYFSNKNCSGPASYPTKKDRRKRERSPFFHHVVWIASSIAIAGAMWATPKLLNGAVILSNETSVGASKIATEACLPMRT